MLRLREQFARRGRERDLALPGLVRADRAFRRKEAAQDCGDRKAVELVDLVGKALFGDAAIEHGIRCETLDDGLVAYAHARAGTRLRTRDGRGPAAAPVAERLLFGAVDRARDVGQHFGLVVAHAHDEGRRAGGGDAASARGQADAERDPFVEAARTKARADQAHDVLARELASRHVAAILRPDLVVGGERHFVARIGRQPKDRLFARREDPVDEMRLAVGA